MQNGFIIKFIFPSVGLAAGALLIDQFLIKYFPFSQPIKHIKMFLEEDNKLIPVLGYVINWYGLSIAMWVWLHFRTFWDIFTLLKQSYSKKQPEYTIVPDSQTAHKQSQLYKYSTIVPTNEANSSIQSIQVNQVSHSTTEKKSLSNAHLSQSIVVITTIFTILFLVISLVESQISMISSSFKNGTHHSKWMGANEYYTQDFFHNIPAQFKDNHNLLELFQIQDKSVSAMRNWVGNFKLFYGLFHLGVKSLGPVVLIVLILLMVFAGKICSSTSQKAHKKRQKWSIAQRILMHMMELAVVNILFTGLIGFGFLSSVFAELKMHKKSELCSNSQSLGGLELHFDSRVEKKIFAEIIQSQSFVQRGTSEPDKHKIFYVFENLCEVLKPYYTKTVHLQEIFLFGLRVSELLFVFVLISMIWSKLNISKKAKYKLDGMQENNCEYNK